jgi:hypothetical protein
LCGVLRAARARRHLPAPRDLLPADPPRRAARQRAAGAAGLRAAPLRPRKDATPSFVNCTEAAWWLPKGSLRKDATPSFVNCTEAAWWAAVGSLRKDATPSFVNCTEAAWWAAEGSLRSFARTSHATTSRRSRATPRSSPSSSCASRRSSPRSARPSLSAPYGTRRIFLSLLLMLLLNRCELLLTQLGPWRSTLRGVLCAAVLPPIRHTILRGANARNNFIKRAGGAGGGGRTT